MAKSIMPPQNVYDIAGHVANEADSLRKGVRLMYDQLAVGFDDREGVETAIGNLYFLTQAVDDLAARLEEISIAAYAIAKTKATA